MDTPELEKLRYPIGKFEFNSVAGNSEIKKWISDIEKLPPLLKKSLKGLDEKKLNTPYRQGGWTVKQVTHHLADSHINAYARIKLALTENQPTIKPYDETLWAELDDAKNLSIKVSLSLLDALHTRWVHTLKKLSDSDYERSVFHPGSKREMSIKFLIHLYSWHGKHHCAHITSLRKRNKW
jgi:uncharacterized damage-inducible protein DinB